MKIKLVVLAVIVSLASPLAAQSTDLTLWLTSQRNDEGGRFSPSDDEEVRFDSGSGFGVSVSRFAARHSVSGELAVFRTSSSASLRDGGQTLASLGDVDLMPVTAMIRVHRRARAVDLYAGAGVAYVLVGDLESADLDAAGVGPVKMSNKTTYAFGAGVSFALTPRIGLALDARFIPLELQGRLEPQDEELSASLDPLLLSGGVRFRF